MASRHEIINYIKNSNPEFASQYTDEELYEWARKRYSPSSPTWEEYDKPIDIQPSSTIKEVKFPPSTLEAEDGSPQKLGWLSKMTSYNLAEEFLGKGMMPEMNPLRAMSKLMGVDDDFWEQAYVGSNSNMIYSGITGEDKYKVDDYEKGAIADGLSFLLGLGNIADASLFAGAGFLGLGGRILGEFVVRNTLLRGGLKFATSELAKSRPFLRSMISSGFQQSASLGTFFAGNSAMRETGRQGKEIKAGRQESFEIDKIVNEAVHGGKEGVIIGGAIGIGIAGTMGTRYGQLILKEAAEGKHLARFEKIQKGLTHPFTRLNVETGMFTFASSVIEEDAPPMFSDDWWSYAKDGYLSNGIVLAGLKNSGKVWNKIRNKKTTIYGEDADRILMDAWRDAETLSKNTEKPLENVAKDMETEGIGEAHPGILDAIYDKITTEKISQGRSEKEFESLKIEVTKLKDLLAEIADYPNDPGELTTNQLLKVKEAAQLSMIYDNELMGSLLSLKNNESVLWDRFRKIKGRAPTDAEKEGMLQRINLDLDELVTIRAMANYPLNGGALVDGDRHIKMDNAGKSVGIEIFQPHVKITQELISPKDVFYKGAPDKGEPGTPPKVVKVLGEIQTTLGEISEKTIPVTGVAMKKAEFSKVVDKYNRIDSQPTEKLTDSELLVRNKISADITKKRLAGSDERDKIAYVDYLEIQHGKGLTKHYVNSMGDEVATFIDYMKNKNKSTLEISSSDLVEYMGKRTVSFGSNQITGLRTYYDHLRNYDYIRGREHTPIMDVIEIKNAEINDASMSGPPAKEGVRKAAKKIAAKIGEKEVLATKLSADYGIRDEEVVKVTSKEIKQTKNGDYYIDLLDVEVRKYKTLPRVVWIDAELAGKLKSFLDAGGSLEGSTSKVGKGIKALGLTDKKGKFFTDLRKRLSSVMDEVLDGKEYRAAKWMLGHEKTRIEKIYNVKGIEKNIEIQKQIHAKLKGLEVEAPKKKIAVEPDISGTIKQQVAFYERAGAREKEQMKNLRTELSNAKNQSERMNIQGQINDLSSSMKATGMTLSALKKQLAKKTLKTVGEPFKEVKEMQDFVNKYMDKNKGLWINIVTDPKFQGAGDYLRGVVNLALGRATPHTFFHENAHRLKDAIYKSKDKSLQKLWERGESLVKGEENLADRIADVALKYERGGKLGKLGQWFKTFLSKFKKVFSPKRMKAEDIANIFGEKVGKGFEYKAPTVKSKALTRGNTYDIAGFGISEVTATKPNMVRIKYERNGKIVSAWIGTGELSKRSIIPAYDKRPDSFYLALDSKTGDLIRVRGEAPRYQFSNKKEHVSHLKTHMDKIFQKFDLSAAEKREVIKAIGEDAGLGDGFKLSENLTNEQLDIFNRHLSTLDLPSLPRKVNMAKWLPAFLTVEKVRVKANISDTQNKKWLSFLGVKDGNIFKANYNQLKSYSNILHKMKYERRSDTDWIDDGFMLDNVPADLAKKFVNYGGLRQSALPVFMVFRGMGLEKLASKMIDHTYIEQGYIGKWVVWEDDAIRLVSKRKFDKIKDHFYLFDRKRYLERKEEGRLTSSEKKFMNSATTEEFRNPDIKTLSTNKFFKSETAEGKLGESYKKLTEFYPEELNFILSDRMNPAELEKWKKDNNVKWIKNNIYMHRSLTDKFKKLYQPGARHYGKILEREATRISEELAEKRYGKKYTEKQLLESYDDAYRIASAEINDLFTFSPDKFSSKFFKSRHVKLKEFEIIDGKEIQVYDTSYNKTIMPYAFGMAKLYANLSIFPDFVKLKGFKVHDTDAILGKLKIIHPKHGDWVKQQINRRLGIGEGSISDMGQLFVTASAKYAHTLAQLGLSFPTAGAKNLLLGSTQTLLAFKTASFMRGFVDAMSRENRKLVRLTGATELGLRQHQEAKSVEFIKKRIFPFGMMKITENINRYISVLAGKHDQARGIEILQRYSPNTKEFKKVVNRFKRFYFLNDAEINSLIKYGMDGTRNFEFKDSFTKAKATRDINKIHLKMDTYAHINTQGASTDIFMPFWWSKGAVKPLTLYKRMAYAATVNTMRNLNTARKEKNFMRIAAFSLATYASGELLMAMHHNLLGTPVPAKIDDVWSRLGVVLWKGEFMGILSEGMKFLYGDFDLGFTLYPSIGMNFYELVKNLSATKKAWGKTIKGETKWPIAAELSAINFENYLSKTFSFYNNGFKKMILTSETDYNKDYSQFNAYFRQFGRETELESNVSMMVHSTNSYWQLFEDSWNKKYMIGKKEEFMRAFWLTYWGIATDYHRRGLTEDNITVRTQEDAMKLAGTNMIKKMKALNPNKYTFVTQSEGKKVKGIKFKKWLGDENTSKLDKLENQFWRNHRIWWDKDFLDSLSLFYLGDMKQYFKP